MPLVVPTIQLRLRWTELSGSVGAERGKKQDHVASMIVANLAQFKPHSIEKVYFSSIHIKLLSILYKIYVIYVHPQFSIHSPVTMYGVKCTFIYIFVLINCETNILSYLT